MVVVAEMGCWAPILKAAAPTVLSPPPTEHACKRCAQVEDLLQQIAELQEVVIKLCAVRKYKERGRWFHVCSAMNSQPETSPQDQMEDSEVENTNISFTPRTSRRKRLSVLYKVPQNCWTVDEESGVSGEK